MTFILNKKQLDVIDDVLQRDLFENGVHCVFLIDAAGNNIAQFDNGRFGRFTKLLPPLAASNYAAINAIAKTIGDEEFSLVFHRGRSESVHFHRVADGLVLVNVFGDDVPLGFLRLKTAEAVLKINQILGDDEDTATRELI